jgi:hypothetical protein
VIEQASTDFAEEIARKVFDRVKADLADLAQVKTSSRPEPQEQASSLVFVVCPFSPDMDPIFYRLPVGTAPARS